MGFEPIHPKIVDFKSTASANSATQPQALIDRGER